MDEAKRAWLCGRYVEAEARLTALLLDAPTDLMLLCMRSNAYENLGELDRALGDADRCLEIDPKWYKGYARKAAVLDAMGRGRDALDHLDRGIALAPDCPVLARERARMEARLCDPQVKEEVVEEVAYAVDDEWLEERGYLADVVGECYRGTIPPVAELLRTHAEYRVRWHRREVDCPSSELRRVLYLVYQLSRRVQEHPRVAWAMADACRTIKLFSDARAIADEHDLDVDVRTKQSFELCFFPVRVTCEKEVVALDTFKSLFDRVVCALPCEIGRVECEIVPPNRALLIGTDVLRHHLALLVFRAPNAFAVRVEEREWMGIAQHSCSCIVSSDDNFREMKRIAYEIEDSGGVWVWVYAETHFFAAGPKALRQEGACSLSVPKGTGVLVTRHNLEWTMHRVCLG